ncbi:MAG: PqqD family protein [Acidimicrobiia bacterium]|nr:PqqD family protein [Acidimicrobiia bacterium]
MTKVGPTAEHLIETEVGGDISLYDPTSERVVVLNATASDIWRLCDGEQTLDEVIDLIAKAYDQRPDEIRPHVTTTIEQFREEGFLVS